MTRLPSLESLRIFAAAARHLSFTTAAKELSLTQSAVSHRIKALEEELGVVLFNRLIRRLSLTDAGAGLAHATRHALSQIERAIADLDRTGGARRLTVTMLPSVASRWLIPRLSRFRELHPEIEVQVVADPRLFDLRAERIDLALRFGRGPYPGYAVTDLMSDRVFPVCSPDLVKSRRVETIDQLIELPLLHDSTTEGDGSGSDWRSWLDHLGRRDIDSLGGQRFNDASLLIQAAVSGLGVALGRASLVTDQIVAGALICPLPLTAPTVFTYHLLALPEAHDLPKIILFREWLRAEAVAMADQAIRLGT